MSTLSTHAQIGHVLVDVISSVADRRDDVMDPEVLKMGNLAVSRIREIPGAVEAKFDDETLVLDLDLSHVINASLLSMQFLIDVLVKTSGSSHDDVITGLREYLNELD